MQFSIKINNNKLVFYEKIGILRLIKNVYKRLGDHCIKWGKWGTDLNDISHQKVDLIEVKKGSTATDLYRIRWKSKEGRLPVNASA